MVWMSVDVCWRMMVDWCDDLVNNWCWMNGWSLVNDSVETMVVIGGVVNGSD
jgi:hypothetical protein